MKQDTAGIPGLKSGKTDQKFQFQNMKICHHDKSSYNGIGISESLVMLCSWNHFLIKATYTPLFSSTYKPTAPITAGN